MPTTAIQTPYKGVIYRSRTEARWAAFFDYCRVPVEYEAEGFELGGERYLPDFRVQAPACFIEIKGQAPTKGEVRKAERLVQASGSPVLILSGAPVRSKDYRHVFLSLEEGEVLIHRVGLALLDRTPFLVEGRGWDIFWLGARRELSGMPLPGEGVEDAVAFATKQRFGVHE